MTMGLAFLRKIVPRDDASIARVVEALQRSITRMNRTVTDLSTFYEIEEGAITLEPRPTALADLIEAVAAPCADEIRRRGVALEVEPGVLGAERVRCDPDKTSEILARVVVEAVEVAAPDGRLRIALESANGAGVRVVVEAHAAEALPLADGEAAEPPPTVATALARALAELQGGGFGASRAASGETYWMSLPLARD